LKVCSETGETPVAEVTLNVDGTYMSATMTGGGPVDAAFKAMEEIINCGCKLLLYAVNNITTGTDSQGEVTVRIEKDSRIVNGTGSDTDIVIASAKAYLNAMNKMKIDLDRAHPQSSQPPI